MASSRPIRIDLFALLVSHGALVAIAHEPDRLLTPNSNAWLAQNELDPNVKAALDFALLEDFDHLYRYANILAMKGDGYMTPEQIVGKLTEITPGRPTWAEHRHPKDSVRSFIDYSTASPQTIMNIMTIVAGEQQTMNFYHAGCAQAEGD